MKEDSFYNISLDLSIFRNGIPANDLSAAATLNNGIKELSSREVEQFVKIYDNTEVEKEKFVPASGAATRMFRDLLKFKNEGQASEFSKLFFSNLDKIPFDLNGTNDQEILADLFHVKQMDRLPKGLIPFHRYDKNVRTAAEEHLSEAAGYVETHGKAKLHFTVSPEHLEMFEMQLKEIAANFPTIFNLSFSTQNPKTDTIAVDLNNEPFKDENGEHLFRPAGHGALLENLNQLDSDIIFIKNIDNVIPDRLKAETIKFKKVLGGVLLDYQQRAFDLLERNETGELVLDEGRKLLKKMGLKGNPSDSGVIEKLNRPIRVCGMVRNLGEPGGGPFWVKTKDGLETLQIVEEAQIDHDDAEQEAIFNQSTHFNPVDLVCGVKNYKGEKFNLMKYRDPNTGFISQKSYEGQPIKVLELPGLWNGSMADWNTIFIEVPLITFNPVKTVNDLLRAEHQTRY